MAWQGRAPSRLCSQSPSTLSLVLTVTLHPLACAHKPLHNLSSLLLVIPNLSHALTVTPNPLVRPHSHSTPRQWKGLPLCERSCAPALQLTLCDALLAFVYAGPSSFSVPPANVASTHARVREGSCAYGRRGRCLTEHAHLIHLDASTVLNACCTDDAVLRRIDRALGRISKELIFVRYPVPASNRTSGSRSLNTSAYDPASDKDHRRCLVSGMSFPKDEVIAAHVFQRQWNQRLLVRHGILKYAPGPCTHVCAYVCM